MVATDHSTPPPAKPLARLLRYARPHRKRIIAATACSILNKLFDLAPPVLIGAAIDVVVRGDDSLVASFGVEGVMPQLVVLGVITVLIWAAESAFEYAYALLWRNLAQTIQHDLRVDTYQHVQDLDLSYFEDQSTGGLMAVLNDDVNQLERFLDGGANDLLQVATTVIAVGIAFFGLSPGVALLTFIPVPLVLFGSFWFQSRIGPRYAHVREHVAILNGQLSNNLGGIATIKSFTTEKTEVARIRGLSEAYRSSNRHAIRLSSAFSPLIRMAIVIGFTGTLIYGGWLVESGALQVGAYSVLVFLTQRLLWPLTRLGATFDLYQRAMASTERVLDLLDTPSTILPGDVALPVGEVAGEVSVEGVSFSYASGPPVLRDISLHVPAGKTLAIVGATGSGKSTLIKLLLRLYDVHDGRVTLDGHDVRDLDTHDLRRAIGLVSQDVFLFHGSIAENIAYGSPNATPAEIEEAARLAEAHDFVVTLPKGYDTVVGERGQKLSGGQRQRISIARALLKKPPVLIFDEATSAVDNETEAAIQRSLARIGRDRTVIVIAHRLSTIRRAHQICVLEGGRVVEGGTHDELIAKRGLYHRLWSVQTGEEAVAA